MQDGNTEKPLLENLINDLYHPNPNINFKACKNVIKYWPNESVNLLVKNLGAKNIFVRRKSVNALSNFGIIILEPIANLFLSTKNDVVRISCLKILVRLPIEIQNNKIPPHCINVINHSIKDDNPQIILLLTSFLKQIGISGVDFLKYLAKDKNVLRAKAAVTALSEIDDPSIEQFMRELIDNKSIDDLIKNSVLDYLNSINYPR
tara:strand:+ start:8830 stop:9444 length:615 start_codon:yes stop_codon:yes gene_type:complete